MNAESTREALDVASLAGDILLASGAEIFRVEETIERIARAYGVSSSDAFVLSSGIFLTAESGKRQEFARVRHIPLSAARLDKVTAVNQLSREIEEGLHTPKEAKAWLLDIQRMPDKPRWHQVLASGVGSACFCFLFGGDVVDSMVAFLSGFVLYFYLLYLLRGRMSKIATNISGGALLRGSLLFAGFRKSYMQSSSFPSCRSLRLSQGAAPDRPPRHRKAVRVLLCCPLLRVRLPFPESLPVPAPQPGQQRPSRLLLLHIRARPSCFRGCRQTRSAAVLFCCRM